MTNCPNCGAVITGSKCEYCGTIFEKDVYIELDTSHFDICKAILDFQKTAHNFGSTIIR